MILKYQNLTIEKISLIELCRDLRQEKNKILEQQWVTLIRLDRILICIIFKTSQFLKVEKALKV